MSDCSHLCIAPGGCRSPTACGGFGYCRERNFNQKFPGELSVGAEFQVSGYGYPVLVRKVADGAYHQIAGQRAPDGSNRIWTGGHFDFADLVSAIEG